MGEYAKGVPVVGEKIRVYADVREEQSGIPDMLESLGVIVIKSQLQAGDYVLPGDTVVERKTAQDFVNSLFDGRLFDQVSRLSESYSNVIILVEGEMSELRRVQNRAKQVYSALATLTIDYDVKIVSSPGPRDSALIIEALARRIVEEHGVFKIVIHKKPKLSTIREWQLYIAGSLPGVGPKLAERLLEKFKSVEAIFTASTSELKKVLGEKRAEKIKAIIKTPYEPKDRKPKSLEDYRGNQ